MTDHLIGKTIRGYKVLKFLGEGKYSSVFHAENISTHQKVAMKVIQVIDVNH